MTYSISELHFGYTTACTLRRAKRKFLIMGRKKKRKGGEETAQKCVPPVILICMLLGILPFHLACECGLPEQSQTLSP